MSVHCFLEKFATATNILWIYCNKFIVVSFCWQRWQLRWPSRLYCGRRRRRSWVQFHNYTINFEICLSCSDKSKQNKFIQLHNCLSWDQNWEFLRSTEYELQFIHTVLQNQAINVEFQYKLFSFKKLYLIQHKISGLVKRKMLVLDLDETLIHSHHDAMLRPTVKPGTPPDFVLKVTIDKHPVRFFVHKRPHVDYFLDVVSCCLFLFPYITNSIICFNSWKSPKQHS